MKFRKPLRYIAPCIVIIFIFSVFFTGWWNGPSQYSARESFSGCYADETGDTFELSSTGIVRSSGKRVGTFQIVSPVGGKHGYLVEASGMNLKINPLNGRIIALAGSGGFIWPISQNGELTVIFAPDIQRVFQRVMC
jgi:hypothetical protein